MRIRTTKKRALSLLLTLAVVACYSMVALAGEAKLAGEIVVSGGKDSVVTVNGEAAKSGRTVFSSSTIATPADASAVISVKNIGKLRVGPNTTMTINFDEKGITGSIEKGKLTVLDSANTVNITAPNGKVAALGSGDAVITTQDDDDDDDPGSGTWFIWALVLGGAAAGLIFAATRNNDISLGGGTTVVSPNR
ncbi:MAG: hypothetical protein OEM82_06250 [Acidobacteriota bacterium]|nr:hypothetical protein [Acidobacteriota bacterium]MDH3529606.1 hypothetical protein [Acidobacteriota bacterium]